MTNNHLFFFMDTATTQIYTLSLHDALPILFGLADLPAGQFRPEADGELQDLHPAASSDPEVAELVEGDEGAEDRKSTRLNSSHSSISYAVFCLKKKKLDLPEHAR